MKHSLYAYACSIAMLFGAVACSSAHADTRGGDQASPTPAFTTYYEKASTYLGDVSWSDTTLVTDITRNDDTQVENNTGVDLYYWTGASCPSVNVTLDDGDSHMIRQGSSTVIRNYNTVDCATAGGATEITLTLTGTSGGSGS